MTTRNESSFVTAWGVLRGGVGANRRAHEKETGAQKKKGKTAHETERNTAQNRGVSKFLSGKKKKK